MTDSSVPASAQSVSGSLLYSSPAALTLTSGSSASSCRRAFAHAFPLSGMVVAPEASIMGPSQKRPGHPQGGLRTTLCDRPFRCCLSITSAVTALRVCGSYVLTTLLLYGHRPLPAVGVLHGNRAPLPLFPHPGTQGRGRARGCTWNVLVD